MATSIKGMYDSRGIQPIHWQKELIRLDFKERFYAARLSGLADRVHEALPRAIAWVAENGGDGRLVDTIAGLVTMRVRVLHEVRQLPPAVARPSHAQRRRGTDPRG